jgi:hypothetical protein
MKLLKQLWDFVFGVLLIGGAPLGVVGLVTILGDLYQRLFSVTIPDSVGMAVTGFGMLVAFAAFIAAIWYRLRHRLIPRGFAVAEAVLGVVGAVMFMALIAMQYIQ